MQRRTPKPQGGVLRGGVRMRINLELPLTRYRADTVSILSRSTCAPRTSSLFEAKSQLASPHCRVLDIPQVSPAG